MAINQQRLALRFEEATGCTPAKAQKLTKKYLWLCGLEMLQDHYSDNAGSRYYINQTQLQNNLNTIQVNKERIYVWRLFQSFPERVFDIVQTGSNLNKEFSMAQARYTMEDVLMISGTPEEHWQEIYTKQFATEISTGEYDTVRIDQRSLDNYIKSNLSQDRDNPRTSAGLIEEWDRNLKHAQKFQKLAAATNGELVQVRNESKFGRRYYKGPNLQNCPKMVRHAALGACHEYDIESSVFAWKLSWFKTIRAAEGKPYSPKPATLEYLDHKQALRRRLAQTVFETESDWAVKLIKEFITAIGFGAPLRGVGYIADGQYQKPALAQIITAKNKLDRAMADPWVQEFVQEQTDMNDAIVALAKVNMIDDIKNVPELWEKGGKKLKPNSIVSYLYQHAEREILDWAEEFCADREVLLTVHDCIYTRRPVKLMEFRAGIQGFGEFFKLEHKEHRPYGWEDPVSKDDPFYDPRDAVIAQQAQRYADRRGVDFWNGTGYDGTQEYDFEDDPYFQDEIS